MATTVTTPGTRSFGLAVLDDIVERVTQRVAAVGVTAILLVACLTVLDVVLRNFFRTSLYGLNEINVLLIALAVAVVLPSGMARRVSLNIEILHMVARPGVVAWFKAAGAASILLFFSLLAWRIGVGAHMSGMRNETTMMTDILKAPFYWGVTAGVAVAALVQILVTIRSIVDAWTGTPRAAPLALAILVAAFCSLALLLSGAVETEFFVAFAPSNGVLLAGLVFLLMWVTILGMVPLGPAMGLWGLVGTMALLGVWPALDVLGAESKAYITQDALSVLPLFLLMGTFASVAGIGSDIYRLAYAILGHMRGGLAHATIAACAGFGALTGSSMATQMTIGRIAMPEMRSRGYSPEITSGSIAAGGTLGQLVPPSTALILYAVMAEQSVGKLFMAAVVPGLLAMLLYMATVMLWVWTHPDDAPRGDRTSTRELAAIIKDTWAAILLLGLVLGGIYGGFFTELEAGSVGAAGAFLLALTRGKINRDTLWSVMGETTSTIALMYSLLFGTVMLSFFFGISHLPQYFISMIDAMHLSPMGVIIALVLCYLILGTAMDSWAMMVITVPIFVPLVVDAGYDPIWWGIMTVICMEAGQISPPFGLNIFLISSLAPDIPVLRVFRGCWPFFWSTCVKIALLVAFPALTLWLPNSM